MKIDKIINFAENIPINQNLQQEIIAIFISKDKRKVSITFHSGIIKIYEIKDFKLLYNINFINECQKLLNKQYKITNYFYSHFLFNGNIIISNNNENLFYIEFNKEGYTFSKLLTYKTNISFITDIKSNNHFAFGAIKLNIYDNNIQFILSLKPKYLDYYDYDEPPIIKDLLYLHNKQLLICLVITYLFGADRISGITIWNTKNNKYNFMFYIEDVYTIDYPYTLQCFHNKYLFNTDIYINGNMAIDLNSFEQIHIDEIDSYEKYGFPLSNNIIFKSLYDKNKLIQIEYIDNKNKWKYCGERIFNELNNEQDYKLLKISDEIFFFYDKNKICFIKQDI